MHSVNFSLRLRGFNVLTILTGILRISPQITSAIILLSSLILRFQIFHRHSSDQSMCLPLLILLTLKVEPQQNILLYCPVRSIGLSETNSERDLDLRSHNGSNSAKSVSFPGQYGLLSISANNSPSNSSSSVSKTT